MADEENSAAPVPAPENYRQATLVRTTPEPPVVFADGIVNQIMGSGISKFHFYRNDAVMGTINVYEKVDVLQVIMPASAFVDMVAFFEHRLRVMVKYNNVTQEMIDERRRFYSDYPV